MTTYRVDVHCRHPEIRFRLERLNQHGVAVDQIGCEYRTLAHATSLIGFGATDVIITPAARRAEMERTATKKGRT